MVIGACAAAAAGYGMVLLFRWRRGNAVVAGVQMQGKPGVPDDYSIADAESAAQCVTDAFFDDPLIRFLLPDDSVYRREAPFLNRQLIWALHASYKMCDVIRTEEGKTVAMGLWEPASVTFLGGLRFMSIFVALLYRLGPRLLVKFGFLVAALESKRHHYAPSAHHLQTLGTHPEHQGCGLGGKVIEVGIARAEAAGLPSYLESSNPKNVPFYKRHGFQVVEEYFPFANDADKGPVMTLMLRPLPAN